jgi:hypothetical protein
MHGEKFGEYEVFHVEDDDRGEIVRIVKSDSILRNKLEEASYMYKGYKDKHFDICPGAETLRDKLLAGEFKDNKWATGTNFEREVGEWRYQHDVLFKTEKQILQDKEGDESDIEKAKVAIDRIVNLSRDLGIPADRLDYLKAHLKKITDMVEYSSLTEENSLPLKLQWQKDFPSQQEVDDNFSSWQRETHYLADKPVGEWDEYDLSNYNSISRKGGKYDFNPIKETVKFIMDDLEGFSNYFPGGKTKGLTTKEMSTILMQIVKDIEEEGEQLDEGSMCKRGQNYMAARKRAGEKSSAYLSGRGVKVCKGQIKGSDGKKKKSY